LANVLASTHQPSLIVPFLMVIFPSVRVALVTLKQSSLATDLHAGVSKFIFPDAVYEEH